MCGCATYTKPYTLSLLLCQSLGRHVKCKPKLAQPLIFMHICMTFNGQMLHRSTGTDVESLSLPTVQLH